MGFNGIVIVIEIGKHQRIEGFLHLSRNEWYMMGQWDVTSLDCTVWQSI